MERRARAHAHYATGALYEMQDRRQDANEEFRQAALLALDDGELVWTVCRRFLLAQDTATPIELLSQASEGRGASSATFSRLGAVQAQAGDIEAAIRSCETAVEMDPANLQGYRTLNAIYLRDGKGGEAGRVLDEASRHAREDPVYLITLAELYSTLAAAQPTTKKDSEAKALNLLARASTLSITNDFLRLKLADGFYSLNEFEKAEPIYLELLGTMPETSGARDSIRAKLTKAYLGGEDHQKAVEHLEQMLRNDPTNAQVHYLLGWLAQEQKNMQVAEDHFRRAVILAPRYEPAYYGLATTQMAQEKVDDALVTLGEARHRFQQRFQMERLEAMCHMQKEEFAEALRHFTAAEIIAQAMEPESLDGFFYFQYGAAYERNGDYLSAERHLKKCLELMPDFPEAQNYLGYMWADRGTNLQEALELIQAALKAQPDNAAYLDSLAWVLFKLDRSGEALEQMRRAIDLIEEPDPTLYDHLGDIYEALHMPDQAVKAWRRSVEIQADEKVQRKLERALEHQAARRGGVDE